MWLKLLLLLVYISLLFLLSRVLEAISLCESGYGGTLSRQLIDPMMLSVIKLKALLEQRGVSYEGVVEKSELTNLVNVSGQVSAEEAEMSQMEETAITETNFTSGAHFIEQVEDAKDSVWLVQVVSNSGQYRVLSDSRWKTIRQKASRFGVRTGFLDCSLDVRYCYQKGWRKPFLLLALPSQFEKKAQVAMYNYSGSVRETSVLRWMRDKLDEKITRIKDPVIFQQEWQNFSGKSLDPEIRAVLMTESTSAPLFYSALSVKFPGRVKFGLISFKSMETEHEKWKDILKQEDIVRLPAYVIYSLEKTYIFGMKPGELYSFASMERFFKFLHPCLNDIFIFSFCVANIVSWFEFFISNCTVFKRLRKFVWCMLKYNIVVIMLWLPMIGVFQMPYLDRIPLLALKMERILTTSHFGTMLRGDYSFYLYHPYCIFLGFGMYLLLVTYLCKRYRQEGPDEEEWFNFSQMGTLTHLRPNDFFEPMRISGYDLMGGLEVFGSHLSQPSLWLQPTVSPAYIKHLPTWRYCPQSLATRAVENIQKVEMAMAAGCSRNGNESVKSSDNMPQCPHHSGNHSCNIHKPRHPSNPSLSKISCSCHSSLSNKHAQCGSSHLSSEMSDLQSAQPPSSGQEGSSSISSHLSDVHFCGRHPRTCHHSHQHKGHCSTTHLSCNNDFNPSSNDTVPESSSMTSSDIETTPSDSVLSSLASESFHTSSSQPAATVTPNPQIPQESCLTNPSTSSGFPAGYLESHQCVICLEEYTFNTMLCGLPCGHVFHETCIIAWLNREKHFCPMCRWPSYKLLQSSS